MLNAENECSSKQRARNLWSPALRKAGQEVTYWKRCLCQNGYLDDGTRDFGLLLGLLATKNQPMDISLYEFYLSIAWKTYRGIQTQAWAKEQASHVNGDIAAAIKQNQQHESNRTRLLYSMCNHKQDLSTLDTPDLTYWLTGAAHRS